MNKSRVILFLKVFGILFVLGFLIPQLIKIVLSNVNFFDNQIPSGNSVFVMHSGIDKLSLKDILCNILKKFMDF